MLPILAGPGLVVGPAFVCFEVPGDPIPKGRHRARVAYTKDRKPYVMIYPDSDTVAYEKTISRSARLFMSGRDPSDKPLAILVHAYVRVPKSWSNKDRTAALAGFIRPTSRPDGDNYLKAVQDALNEIVWKDDSQIIDARVLKEYSDSPAMRIEVREFIHAA